MALFFFITVDIGIGMFENYGFKHKVFNSLIFDINRILKGMQQLQNVSI